MACNWHVMDGRVDPVANLKILTTASPFRSLVIIARLLFSLVYWHMVLLMKNHITRFRSSRFADI